ncbi:ABC transporter ATP-binding protein [Rhodoligotrophos defluvii]|uniref:ABC transporter ATP-binding protein n=1 Tax=Rhodoligotrophos defluvii TaxID=2561934 RepID=UPI0010C9499D|nr:ABC transporter ATP-binding protein [Rhodoligotrophos defluvii]
MSDSAGQASAPLIRFVDVTKRFGTLAAVDGLDLDIDAGTFVAIMGPSGCGKTTTLRMLAGLEAPTSGRILFNGADITHQKPWERNMPMVWQSLALFPFLDVLGNVTFGLKMSGLAKAERDGRAMRWLERLGIAPLAHANIGKISGGQAQRVALARALVTEPNVLLLDEPLSALDAHLVVRMQAELTKLQKELGITFVYVTHSQSEAFAMADRVVIMNEGRIQQNGTPREVFRRPANRFVAEFVGTNNIIEGRVAALSGGMATVETTLGSFQAPAGAGLAVGRAVDLVISADRVRLARVKPEDIAAVPVTVISEQFVGTMVTVHLDAGTERNIRVQMPQHAFDALDLTRGDRLYASWLAEDALLLTTG